MLLFGAGCTVAPPTAEASPPRGEAPARTAPPSPTPTGSAETVLSTAGLGALRMGSPVPADAPVRWNPAACPAYGADGSPTGGSTGLWEATDPVSGTISLDRATPFGLLTDSGTRQGPIALLQVWSSQYRTASGLRVGSADGEVRAALPRASVLSDGQSRAYSVVSRGWRLTITVADSGGGPLSDRSTVQIISVYPASEPETSWWNTDVGAGCGV